MFVDAFFQGGGRYWEKVTVKLLLWQQRTSCEISKKTLLAVIGLLQVQLKQSIPFNWSYGVAG